MFALKVEERKRKLKSEAHRLFRKHMACKCCARHQLRRPKSLDDDQVFESFVKMEGDLECLCTCRQTMRSLNLIARSSLSGRPVPSASSELDQFR